VSPHVERLAAAPQPPPQEELLVVRSCPYPSELSMRAPELTGEGHDLLVGQVAAGSERFGALRDRFGAVDRDTQETR